MRTVRWLVAAAAIGAAARASAAQGGRLEGLQVGGFLGYESADVAGLSLRADGVLPLATLGEIAEGAPVRLAVVGSLGYSRLTQSVLFGDFVSNVFKVVPAARLTLALGRFEPFADLGLGLAWIGARIEKNEPFFGASTVSHSTLNWMMRLGAGVFYAVRDDLRVGAMLELDPIFGDYGFPGAASQTTTIVLAGATYRL